VLSRSQCISFAKDCSTERMANCQKKVKKSKSPKSKKPGVVKSIDSLLTYD
jgi:hypothetical protein